MSRLQKIQVTTQQTAEAIASVLGMDVTIVDDLLVRIAATGHHERFDRTKNHRAFRLRESHQGGERVYHRGQ